MLGVGWTEMLIIGVVALVVIGPKDLPVVMQKLGKFVGMVRRMGTDFQRELNKTTGLDQITDLKRSLTEPLRQTSAEIAREFNAMATATTETQGVVKPEDPKVESVYSAINTAAGVPDAKAEAPAIVAEPDSAAARIEGIIEGETPKAKAARKPRARKAPVAASEATTLDAVTTPAEAATPRKGRVRAAAPARRAASKPAAAQAVVPVEPAVPPEPPVAAPELPVAPAEAKPAGRGRVRKAAATGVEPIVTVEPARRPRRAKPAAEPEPGVAPSEEKA